jgi:AcrR family transcriptional regulator
MAPKAKTAAVTGKKAGHKGEQTRESILRAAVDLASLEGLEGLTIGRLARELKMSKSGLFAHFGSKQDLQLATVEMASEIFKDNVVLPSLTEPKGMPRLLALCEQWLSHVENKVFAGGCFFTAASFEFDSRPGPVRGAIVKAMSVWLSTLTRAIEEAQKIGHLKGDVKANQLALEIYSLAVGGHWASQLLGQRTALANARESIRTRLASVSLTEQRSRCHHSQALN